LIGEGFQEGHHKEYLISASSEDEVFKKTLVEYLFDLMIQLDNADEHMDGCNQT